jgi:energy-coupling factor transporter ATP-binding protein EcfA2
MPQEAALLRIDLLDTSATEQLGAHVVRNLAGFDLVVIHGPNGSGKTTLASLAMTPNRGMLAVDLRVGQPIAFDRSVVCEPKLLHRNSAQLMAPFENLESALRAAAGLDRLRQEEALLRLLLGDRSNSRFGLRPKLVPTAVSQTPAEVAQAVDDYLTADRALSHARGSFPLVSLQTFNTLAAELARLRAVMFEPVSHTGVSDLARAIELLTPRLSQQPGMADVSGALQRLVAALPSETSDVSDSQLAAAERACLGAIESAAMLLEPHRHPTQPTSPSAWTNACLTLGDEMKREAAELQAMLARRDQERELRRQAKALLEQEHGFDECPVCQHQQSRSLLAQTLTSLLSSPDASTAAAQERLARCKELESDARHLAMQLEQVAESRKTALTRIDRERGGWMLACTQAIAALQPNDGWTSSIRETAQRISQQCREAINIAGAACREAMCALREHATRSVQTLQAEDRNMHRSHEYALQLHEQLRALGRALLKRSALNVLPWPCTCAQEAGRAARLKVVETWVRSVNRVIEDRKARMNNATSAIVEKPEVRTLFERLISKIQHPLLPSGTTVGPSSVKQPGSDAPIDTSEALSEGYRVLVNLAAFIALAAGAQGHAGHACGWIVLDEPTNGLDPFHRNLVAEYLGSLSTADMPCQIIVATFDERFMNGLVEAARRSNRRWKVLELPAWPLVQTQGIRERSS